MDKFAAEQGGQLELFYKVAQDIASDMGVDPEYALNAAAEALESKVAMDAMFDEIDRIGGAREAMAEVTPEMEAWASYVEPSGPYAGIQRVLDAHNAQQ